MEIKKDWPFFAGRHVPNNHLLAVSGVKHRLFRFGEASRPRISAPALWKVLERALRHVKQGDYPAVTNDCNDDPLHYLELRQDAIIEPTNESTAMTKPDLIRFVNAQAQVYSQVIDELTGGRKRTHWIWFIFPQLAGLGHSAMAQRYAIRDLEQARRYLADPILG